MNGSQFKQKRIFVGQAIFHTGGFAILDRGLHNRTLRVKRFQTGHDGDDRYYPGYEMNSVGSGGVDASPTTAIVLRRLGGTTFSDLRSVRRKMDVELADTPVMVAKVLDNLQNQ